MSVLEQISVLGLTMLLFLGIERAIQSHIERASIERGGDPFVRADHNQVRCSVSSMKTWLSTITAAVLFGRH